MRLFLLFFLFSFPLYAQTDSEIIKQLEELIKQNQELSLQVKELQLLQEAHPELELEPLQIVVDKNGRVFVTDSLAGKLKLGNLKYDVVINLKTTISQSKRGEFGLTFRAKAAALQSYELDDFDNVRTYVSPALMFEVFYYRDFNFNFMVGTRLYGASIGMDVTKHFGVVTGIGFKYNDEKAPIIGVAFDF